jgi:CRP/FNR family cyclic AMP-dependent transcriptional regulator
MGRMNALWGNIFKGKHEQDEEVLAVLGALPIFAGLSRRELRSVERIMHRRFFAPDEVIFSQNVQGAGMYIIVKGKVHIVNEDSGHVLAELGDGEFFGELALLDESPRSATAIARSSSKVLGFFQPDLFSLTESNPRLGVKVITQLARIVGNRLRVTNDQLQDVQEELDALKSQ